MKRLSATEESSRDRATFMRTQVAFWLLAVTDGHAKNFSLRLLPGGRAQLLPLYDVRVRGELPPGFDVAFAEPILEGLLAMKPRLR